MLNKKMLKILAVTFLVINVVVFNGCTMLFDRSDTKKPAGQVKADTAKTIISLSAKEVSKLSNGAMLFKDSSAPGGLAVKLPVIGKVWAVQWQLNSRLASNVNYLVRIKIKADKVSSKGSAFVCGIYSIAKKKTPLKAIINAEELDGKRYQWVNCGNVNGSDIPKAYFYLAQLLNSAVKNIYVTTVEFIPTGAPGYKTHVRKKPLYLSPTPQPVKIGEKVYLKPSQTRQILYPSMKLKDGGYEVVSISPLSNYWSTKWHLFNHVEPGVYKIRALIKLTNAQKGGGIRFGVYCPTLRKENFQRMIPATNIPVSKHYQWLDLGKLTVINDKGAYLFVTSFGDRSFEKFLLHKIELGRIK